MASSWVLSALMLLGVGVAAAGLNSIIADLLWWFVIMAVALVVLAAGAAVRSFAKRRIWPTVATAVTAVAAVTLVFAPSESLLAVIPTTESVERFGDLVDAGVESITLQGIPANADTGILFLLCVGVAVIAFAMDTVAFTLRMPAVTGVPLLVLLLVPSIVRSELDDGFYFVLTAAAWIAILLVGSNRSGRRMAVGIAVVAVTAGLVVPFALPPLGSSSEDTGPGFSTGINPIITLGDDLRRDEPMLALRYSTTDIDGEYLRLTVLDDFNGSSWLSSNPDAILGNNVDAIGAAPGLGENVRVTPITTDIRVFNVLSRWLPAPYAPTRVTGLVGEWSWEPDALAIRTQRSSARGQVYTVESVRIAPSIDLLTAAGTTVEPGLERYLAVPDFLPPVVASTALEVTAGATTNYDKAVALQSYFRDGDFTYSEDAPVENGYDGSGATVLGAFLAAKSGYCVHFSAAMATMARTLGIPARIAVGFTPGQRDVLDDGTVEYTVTTYNLHAWPELYFSGIGWVRFEPTPSRGFVPNFPALAVDDPATPNVDESVPAPVSTTASTGGPVRPNELDPTANDPQSLGQDATTTPAPWWLLGLAGLAALLLVPAVVRAAHRSRRMKLVAGGSAAAAWDELRATADDLGIATDSGRTPRQLSDDLRRHLSPQGVDALTRLRAALEAEAFAQHPGAPDPSDVRVVIRSLRHGAGVRARLLATLAPRTLAARWLPEVAGG